MIYISDNYTDPYFNLAEEEYLFYHFKEPIFRLWQNDNAIIVGKNQNTLSEINYDYVKENNIKVVRRLTGGGAVYHDLGNLNYTFIEHYSKKESVEDMFERFTRPIIDALNSLGVKAYLEGRNDLMIDGKKFSGNAVAIEKGRILQHGTLLFESNFDILSNALLSKPEKFQDKAVKSNIKRVTNIREHLNQSKDTRDIGWFKDFLGNWVCTHIEGIKQYTLTEEDVKNIEKIAREKYSADRWNYNYSPKYTFHNKARFKGGSVEVYISVEEGIIKSVEFFGDYFFLNPTENFAKEFIGITYSKEEIAKKISTLKTSAYFSNISENEILDLMT